MLEQDTQQFKQKTKQITLQLDMTYTELFEMNESAKLYNQTIASLKKALHTEKACIEELRDQVKQLRALVREEKAQRDEYLAHLHIQRNQIENFGQKHISMTNELERNLTQMNDTIKMSMQAGIKVVTKLERNSKNMVAAQQSQFYSSKYQASKAFGSMYSGQSGYRAIGKINKSIASRSIAQK